MTLSDDGRYITYPVHTRTAKDSRRDEPPVDDDDYGYPGTRSHVRWCVRCGRQLLRTIPMCSTCYIRDMTKMDKNVVDGTVVDVTLELE